MSDVEKYGLFAVVVVGGLLLVIALQSDPADASDGSGPQVIETALPLRSPPPDGQATPHVNVRPFLNNEPFHWKEDGVGYPGERASKPVLPTVKPTATARGATPSSAGLHTIVDGDTLANLAETYLGRESKWKQLLAWNPGINPKALKLGTTIRVHPDAVAQPTALKKPAPSQPKASSAPRAHTVVKGDTLGAIAQDYLGSVKFADTIYQANRDKLKSPDDLKLGQVLTIP